MSRTLLALGRTGLLLELIIRREIPKLHSILRGLFEDGVISSDLYEEIIKDVAEAVWLEGDELMKKATEIEKKIEDIIDESRGN